MSVAALKIWTPDGDVDVPEMRTGISVSDAVEQYGVAKRLAPRTRAEYGTMLSKLYRWSAASKHRFTTPMLLADLTADNVRDFLVWVEQNSDGENKANSRNKACTSLGALLRWAFDQELIPSLPRIPKKVEQREIAGQYFFTDSEIDAIYWATYKLPCPRGWDLTQPIGAYWRAAIVLFRTYGMDTQALFPYSHLIESVLQWKHVTIESLPPGRVANVENADGYLTIRREKTGRTRIVPLDAVVRAHLELIRPANCDSELPLMGRFGGSKICTAAGGVRPNKRFRKLCSVGKVPKKLDVETGKIRDHELKDLRKTCGTMHDANLPESGVRMLGHSTGTITDKHYSHTLPALIAAMKTFKHPQSFYSIADQSIRPPECLFAK
jgi:integrase